MTGLTTETKYFANASDETANLPQKRTTTAWTQDNTSLSYQKNPRPIEINTYDAAGNRRRVGIEYHSSFGLPLCITEYGPDAATVIRFTVHHFVWSSTYIDRPIIGLPESDWVFDGTWAVKSKTTYGYDWSSHLEPLPNGATAVQHDTANYGTSFVAGRGNLSVVTRWDATEPENYSKAIEYKYGQNVTGLFTFTRDMLWHQNLFSYTDAFSDGQNRNTFAYPTAVTNADGFTSSTQYSFDHGAVTRITTPSPNSGQTAPYQTFSYDSAARLQQVTRSVDGSFRRWVYENDMLSVKSFASILDGTTVGSPSEAYSVQVADGAGRVRAVSSEHPNSVGGYSGVYFVYDNMGRVTQQSNRRR